MKVSVLPILVIIIFIFCIGITRRAKLNQSINVAEGRSVYALLLAFFAWTVIAVVLGIKGIHPSLMEQIPLLWQACVPVVLLTIGLIFSRTLRSGLRGIVANTPWHWLVFAHALRIGAIGGVMKGIKGEITSGFVLWIGIPDFLFGLSALVVGCLLLRNAVSHPFLAIWNLVGASLILLPTFIPMNYWMNEPGFVFIFEFPMVLAPSIVVPIFIFLNLLMAWRIFEMRTE
ncbi:hypothetical protein MYX75_06705 [Acidobacteria bacterium AH-259-A15]|nr:hypothetical protein [Acidobacteria bacterium AH-259-A15]